MLRKPNDGIYLDNVRSKKNQLRRKFNDIFEILFDPDYYEGTKFGKYYTQINEYGQSSIYVKDPLEEELEEIVQQKTDVIKYLVGFTGIGKTTLLRNYFGVFSRDIEVVDDKLIIYISFYYANLSSDKPQKSVEDEIIKISYYEIKPLTPEDAKLKLQEKPSHVFLAFINVETNKVNVIYKLKDGKNYGLVEPEV